MAEPHPNPIARLNAALEGRYRIEREIGQGGMATVYLAEDLRHERKVALKVLKPELAAVVGGERFLAEIKTTANLQHPHILPLFDSGQAESFLYFVMPYVEGDTLRDKIDREKQLSVEEALEITKKVASALDYAHKHGVVHRDIKPGNILLSEEGEPTVADFGIALAVAHAGGGRVTETGLSVGTPHYMSPEQATGERDVDPRTDIYALGCVLYEMLTGDPPYQGSTAQAVLAQILTAKPVASTTKRVSIPPNVDAAIRKALEKVPADRFASAQEFRKALDDPGFRHGDVVPEPTASPAGLWNPLSVASTALAVLLLITTGWALLRREPPEPVSREVLSTRGWAPLTGQLGRYIAAAPDGSSAILPMGAGQNTQQLGLKMRGSTEITPIPETEGAGDVVYSPDGQWIAYVIGNELYKRPIVGGSPVRLAEDTDTSGPINVVGLDWLDDGTILYEQLNPQDSEGRTRRIVQIPEDGGEPTVVFWPEDDAVAIVWARGLPGGRGALVVACPGTSTCTGDRASLYVVDLRDGSYRSIVEQVLRAWYTPTGHLVYVRYDGAVFAVPFDLGSLEFTGGTIPLFDGVRVNGGAADMQLAADGTVLYVEGPGVAMAGRTLVWVDREGEEEPLGIASGLFDYPRLSPDGHRLAVSILAGTGDYDIWVLDLDRGSRSRITFGGNNRYFPVWTAAGDALTYADGNTPPSNAIQLAAADGTGESEPLLERDGLQYPTSWSPDGQTLAYHENNPETLRDLWMLPVGGDPEPFLVTPFDEGGAAFSPNGRWLAYVSNKSGQQEVYVTPFPGPGPEFTISTRGGVEPAWSRDGSELFYRGEGQMMAVPVDTGDVFRAGAPEPLFADTYQPSVSSTVGPPNYDVSADGRFLMVSSRTYGPGAQEADEPAVILVHNFFEELKRAAGG